MSDEKLLSLETSARTLTIEIDGVSYPIPDPQDLRYKDLIFLDRSAVRCKYLRQVIFEADAGEDPPAAAVEELDTLIVGFADMVLHNVPEQVRARLKQSQRLAVMNAFIGTMAPKKDPQTGDGKISPPPDGTPLSSDSADSTGAPGKIGTDTQSESSAPQ